MPDQVNDQQQQPRPEEDFDAWLRRLRELRVRGEAGRRAIVERLATMPFHQLRRVPGWVIARLGPRGMALLAERSRIIRVQGGGSPVPQEPARPVRTARNMSEESVSWLTRLRQRQPLWWECARETSIAAVIGGLLIVSAPLVQRVLPELTAQPSTPRVCSRLDAWTGDCTYVIGSTGLSLSVAADKLRLPLAVLAAANPSFDSSILLPQGARLYVPRRSGINLR
ncbi:hypothetical protein PMI42_03088 [Bradyrhizobium sp. YR681]|uniref:hypothetical protein n=1 Tax=Bradyrhizobium sp. YR681 TaxID=1144344 RepID=UPI000271143A|nr:hypothetical protein [Bradyrhizobium sp. YR681]EJN13515.1 hypothetical protein PMI42_03088 [Bradyrhizobium sp. YR681]